MFKRLIDRFLKNSLTNEEWVAILTERPLETGEQDRVSQLSLEQITEIALELPPVIYEDNYKLLQKLVEDKTEQSPEQVLKSKDSEAVKQMCLLVKTLKWNELVPFVLELFGRQEELLQLTAVDTLVYLGNNDIGLNVISKLKNPRKYNAARIAQTLKGLKVDLGQDLVQIYQEGDSLIKAVVLNVMAELDYKEGKELIDLGLKEQDVNLVKNALEAAYKFFDEEETEALYKEYLHHHNPKVRVKAYEGIANLKPEKALVNLKAGLLEEDWLVRNYCAGKLDALLSLDDSLWSVIKKKQLSHEDKQLVMEFVNQPQVKINYCK